MQTPTRKEVQGKKIVKEIVYTLNCKKNGCTKLEIHRYCRENSKLKKLETKYLKYSEAMNFLNATVKTRIRLPQICPTKTFPNAKTIPWVYGKVLDSQTQVVRYLDESGNRKLLKNNKLYSETIKTNSKTITFNSLI